MDIEAIVSEFDSIVRNDKQIISILKKIRAGDATYKDASRLSSLTGRKLGRILNAELAEVTDPDTIREILQKSCLRNYEVVSDATLTIQTALNTKARIGIKPVVPEYNEERVEGIATELVDKGYERVTDSIPAQIENQSMAIVDDSVRQNADIQYQFGLEPKIVRTSDGRCCEWCNRLAGVYNYPCSSEVYRRHQNCRCVVEYDPGSGRRQNAHTKQWR